MILEAPTGNWNWSKGNLVRQNYYTTKLHKYIWNIMEIKYLKKKYVYQKYNILILRIICKKINIHTEFWKKNKPKCAIFCE